MLKFLGIGSCFNFDMGNTSAYYIDNKEKTMLLFDCGETVLGELGKKGILKDIEKATVIITHLHSDHVGSLPSLIFYFHYVLGKKVDIIYPDKKDMVEKILFTVSEKMYNIYTPKEYNAQVGKYMINEVKQIHSENINAYGYEVRIDDKKIYYSGDANILPEDILQKFLNHEYDYFYHEVTKYESKVHFNIARLMEKIPENRRKEVYCMHIDDEELLQMVGDAGFSVPVVE